VSASEFAPSGPEPEALQAWLRGEAGHVGIEAVGKLPETASFPSGHSTTAFAAAAAAAAAIAVARPALRPWALVLAAIVALSRLYLGMHYLGDVVPGALLGSAIGVGFVLLARRALHTGVTHALRTA
jgi:membrane-associated phospholipid phosphatase